MSDKFYQIHAVAKAYGLSLIYLFGSQAALGNQYLEGIKVVPDETSDLDIAVAFQNPPVLLMETYGHLYCDLAVKKRMMDREIMEAIENGYFQFEYTPHP